MNYIFTKIKFRRDIIVLFKNSTNESEKKQQKNPHLKDLPVGWFDVWIAVGFDEPHSPFSP